MMLLSRQALFAVAAVVDVAMHARPLPVAAKALAARHDLPPRRLETLLQALVRSQILKSVRGPRGGYELARERRRISVADIVRAALEAGDTETEGSPLIVAVIGPLVQEAGETMLKALEAISVEALCLEASRKTRPTADAPAMDFTI